MSFEAVVRTVSTEKSKNMNNDVEIIRNIDFSSIGWRRGEEIWLFSLSLSRSTDDHTVRVLNEESSISKSIEKKDSNYLFVFLPNLVQKKKFIRCRCTCPRIQQTHQYWLLPVIFGSWRLSSKCYCAKQFAYHLCLFILNVSSQEPICT